MKMFRAHPFKFLIDVPNPLHSGEGNKKDDSPGINYYLHILCTGTDASVTKLPPNRARFYIIFVGVSEPFIAHSIELLDSQRKLETISKRGFFFTLNVGKAVRFVCKLKRRRKT